MGFTHGRGFDIDPAGKSPVDTFLRNRVEGMYTSDGTTGSTIAADAHDFNLDFTPGIIIIDGKVKAYSSGSADFDVSHSDSAPGMTVGQATVYTIVAYVGLDDTIDLRVVAGVVAAAASAVALPDADIAALFDDKVTAFAITEVKFHRSNTTELTITIDDTVRPLNIPA
jgi:hypothetical protein